MKFTAEQIEKYKEISNVTGVDFLETVLEEFKTRNKKCIGVQKNGKVCGKRVQKKYNIRDYCGLHCDDRKQLFKEGFDTDIEIDYKIYIEELKKYIEGDFIPEEYKKEVEKELIEDCIEYNLSPL